MWTHNVSWPVPVSPFDPYQSQAFFWSFFFLSTEERWSSQKIKMTTSSSWCTYGSTSCEMTVSSSRGPNRRFNHRESRNEIRVKPAISAESKAWEGVWERGAIIFRVSSTQGTSLKQSFNSIEINAKVVVCQHVYFMPLKRNQTYKTKTKTGNVIEWSLSMWTAATRHPRPRKHFRHLCGMHVDDGCWQNTHEGSIIETI